MSLTAHAARAGAGSPPSRGWQLGARVGYALSMGGLDANSNIWDQYAGWIPLGIEAGYRFDPGFYFGGTLLAGPGVISGWDHVCSDGSVSCGRQAFQLTLGPRFYSAGGVWGGFGFGWELATTQISGAGASSSATWSGPVLLDLELGGDWRFGRLSVGPFVSLAFAKYVERSQSPTPAGFSSWFPMSVHAWPTLGVHGTYGL